MNSPGADLPGAEGLALVGETRAFASELVRWRRHLHQHPELGFEEVRTSRFVQETLRGLGLDVRAPLAKTGVSCLIEGEGRGPTVALRADMDALPIQDEKEVAYASSVPGKAHLCGHDAHTTILLGAARLLSKHRPKRGNVKLLFQPAEEGLAGAKAMIEDGALENPKVKAIAGLHVHHSAATGFVTVCPGLCTAAADAFDITVIGKGGHAAHPHLSVDAVAVSAQVISALQHIASRQTDPLSPLVITIGKIEGGYARNVIAPRVRLEGTARTLDPALREGLPTRLKNIVESVCQAFGGSYAFNYDYGFPSSYNDPVLLPVLERTAQDVLGAGRFSTVPPTMGGEDFAFYAREIPGMFFRLGIRNEAKGSVYPLHHPKFDIDEDALPLGAAMLATFALHYLAGAA